MAPAAWPLLPPGGDPHGAAARWGAPSARCPHVPPALPVPVAGAPDVADDGARGADLDARRRRRRLDDDLGSRRRDHHRSRRGDDDRAWTVACRPHTTAPATDGGHRHGRQQTQAERSNGGPQRASPFIAWPDTRRVSGSGMTVAGPGGLTTTGPAEWWRHHHLRPRQQPVADSDTAASRHRQSVLTDLLIQLLLSVSGAGEGASRRARRPAAEDAQKFSGITSLALGGASLPLGKGRSPFGKPGGPPGRWPGSRFAMRLRTLAASCLTSSSRFSL